jgi:type IV secretory pathway VirB10-like protein
MKIKDWSMTTKLLASVVAVIVVIAIIGAASGSSTKTPTAKAAATVPASGVTTPTPVSAPPTTVPPTTVPPPPAATTTTVSPAPSTPALTQQQQNAVQDAESYLSTEPGFSQQGLIQQLSGPGGDGYSLADATAAVDSLTVNWNAQAVDDAQNYNSTEGGFSCSGMIQQLSGPGGDGFTAAQATYGATQAGDC